MIKIKYWIDYLDENEMIKVFYFDRWHERNFEILYKIAQEKIEKRKEPKLNEFLTVWSYRILREIRSRSIIEKKLQKILENKIRNETLNGMRKISFEALIDDLPKKILSVSILLHHI